MMFYYYKNKFSQVLFINKINDVLELKDVVNFIYCMMYLLIEYSTLPFIYF